jgi:hypothetical protein
VTTPFPCFLSTERGCSEAERGLPCEIGHISQGREKVEKGLCGGGTLRTSSAGTGERRLEEGHSDAVPLHGTAVPLLTNGACTPGSSRFDSASALCYTLATIEYSASALIQRGGGTGPVKPRQPV